MTARETNRDLILKCIEDNPEGLDDDQLSEISGVNPRQQVYQIATRLAADGVIRRESVIQPGKRRKIHNFPVETPLTETSLGGGSPTALSSLWRKRLAALVAVTGRDEEEILDAALERFARELLQKGID